VTSQSLCYLHSYYADFIILKTLGKPIDPSQTAEWPSPDYSDKRDHIIPFDVHSLGNMLSDVAIDVKYPRGKGKKVIDAKRLAWTCKNSNLISRMRFSGNCHS
jgi:hypothetical protein